MDTTINCEMLIKYRRHLIPLFIFPTVFFCGSSFLPKELISIVLFPMFFAVTFYAAIPYFTKRASYNYWIMVMGVWICGIIPAIPVAAIVNLITSAE
jgi:hypothetical protein